MELKKHANTFGLVSPKRTFYLQAETETDAKGWVKAITDAKVTLMATSTLTSTTAPIPIPTTPSAARTIPQTLGPISASPSQSPHNHLTSSESEDASPNGPRPYSAPPIPTSLPGEVSSPTKQTGALRDASKPILSGYLMKCGSRRHHWRNRWFVLSGEKLVYCRSHMVRSGSFPFCVLCAPRVPRSKIGFINAGLMLLCFPRIINLTAKYHLRRSWMHWNSICHPTDICPISPSNPFLPRSFQLPHPKVQMTLKSNIHSKLSPRSGRCFFVRQVRRKRSNG